MKIKTVVSKLLYIGVAFGLFMGPMLHPGVIHAYTNLLANPSVETGSATPASWTTNKWGTNSAVFTYITNEGYTGTKSLKVALTSWSSGDAKWMNSPATITPGQTYTYRDYYKSNVDTELNIQFITSGGQTSVQYMGTIPASTTWKSYTKTFTAPTNATKMIAFHIIYKVGYLQTDEYALVQGTSIPNDTNTPPTVNLTAPAANATVSGIQSVTASASDDQGVASVQFKLDGNNLGTADTVAPYSYTWDTTSTTDGSHTLTAVATDTSGTSTTSTPVGLTVSNSTATAPTVSITVPSNNATVSGMLVVSATASDAIGISSVQFKLDGSNIGNPDTTVPFSYNLDTTTIANGTHTITALATNTVGLSTTSAPINVNVQNVVNTPPTVNLIAPAANATVSGTQSVTANATDDVAVASVQFKLDGNNLGAADTTAPYSYSWDTTTAPNGSHTLTAVATDTSGASTTATSVAVTVQNSAPAYTNLFPNPSVETGTTAPTGWVTNKWGTNSTTFAYVTSEGHTGNKSLKVTMTSRSSGDAKWMNSPVTITPGQTYTYRDYYKSNVTTELNIQFTTSSGQTSVVYMDTIPASTSWTSYTKTFTAPSNAQKLTAFHIIYSVGYLQTDDFTLVQGTSIPSGANTPPTVNLIAPAANATVSGTQSVTANATDDVAVASVQFKLDGNNLGAADTTAPYSYSWDTTTAPNGSHTLTAVATDTSGASTVSTAVEVVVSNGVVNPPTGDYMYPLKVSANNRYLVDQNNKPFFYTADTAWTMINKLSVADAKTYIDIRKSQGFNTLQTLLTPWGANQTSPRGMAFVNGDITQPIESYFAGVDEIVDYAESKGMLLYAVPLWMADNGGWGNPSNPAPSASAMTNYMTWIGNRYKNQPNIVWVMGGDDETTRNTDIKLAGARALDATDSNHLITYHPRWDDYGFANESWYDFYSFQKNDISAPYNYEQIRTAYGLNPTKPVLDAEPPYEPNTAMQSGDVTSSLINRRFGWWAALSGAMGVAYGHSYGGTWGIGQSGAPDWNAVNRQQAVHTANIFKILSPLPWQKLVPDWNSQTVTSGRGTYGGTDYATAGRANDGSLIVVFAPSARTFNINLTQLAGASTAQWYDPATGIAVGSPQALVNTGTASFTTPGTNSDNNADWILVIRQN